MNLNVLGSSSNGNCYLLSNDNESIIIECGVNFAEVKKSIDFNISKVLGVLISHSHQDHSGFVNSFLGSRIPVYVSEETNRELNYKGTFFPLLFESFCKFKIGNFTVLPFQVKHDVVCHGFLINHPETGNVLFVTDSYYIPYKFENLHNILIECNYRTDILERNIAAGKIHPKTRDRLLESHMSFETCLEALQANDLSKVNNIVLIHLSDGNSNSEEFRADIHMATSKTVHVADKGLKIPFNKTPF